VHKPNQRELSIGLKIVCSAQRWLDFNNDHAPCSRSILPRWPHQHSGPIRAGVGGIDRLNVHINVRKSSVSQAREHHALKECARHRLLRHSDRFLLLQRHPRTLLAKPNPCQKGGGCRSDFGYSSGQRFLPLLLSLLAFCRPSFAPPPDPCPDDMRRDAVDDECEK
jgi:hypothetical protein